MLPEPRLPPDPEEDSAPEPVLLPLLLPPELLLLPPELELLSPEPLLLPPELLLLLPPDPVLFPPDLKRTHTLCGNRTKYLQEPLLGVPP